MNKAVLSLIVTTCLLFGCSSKNAEFKITNNTGALLTNIEVVTDAGSSFEIESIESGSYGTVILDRSEVGAVEVFVNGKRCFSVNTEGKFGKARIDAIPK